jgi:hypothetical protein
VLLLLLAVFSNTLFYFCRSLTLLNLMNCTTLEVMEWTSWGLLVRLPSPMVWNVFGPLIHR